jgi:hypothetical protein
VTRTGIKLARDRMIQCYGKRRSFIWAPRMSSMPYSIINFLDREHLATSAFTFYEDRDSGALDSAASELL